MNRDEERVRVLLNGEQREVRAGVSVADLVADLGLHPGMVVVEHNREILERSRLAAVEVRDGDVLELVHFVGGG